MLLGGLSGIGAEVVQRATMMRLFSSGFDVWLIWDQQRGGGTRRDWRGGVDYLTVFFLLV